ncbi:MAG: amidohydrolase family protein [Chloroflexota bacterium]|nr:amidohydrolase family protein [Chloroflexota bacterium]
MAEEQTRLIDFHSHYYDPAWMPAQSPSGFSAAFAQAREMLTNIDAQLAAMDASGVDMKVLSAPLSTLVGPGEEPPVALSARINDRFAALVAAYPTRLFALAAIDPFGGDIAAREVERAITTLGLGGVCLDCARGERFLDAPESRPALEAAASLGVPVFVHPVSPAGYTAHLAQHGHGGILMARGTEAAASVLSLVRSGTFDTLPTLTVVIPLMSASILLFAGMLDRESMRDGSPHPLPSAAIKRLYVDTMGFDADTIRFVVTTLGSDHVLVGSDWPIMPIPTDAEVNRALDVAGLTAAERDAVRGGNTLRLFHRG